MAEISVEERASVTIISAIEERTSRLAAIDAERAVLCKEIAELKADLRRISASRRR